MNPYAIIVAGALFLLAVTGAFFEGEHIQRQADQVATDQLKIKAAAVLQVETEKTRAAETAYAQSQADGEKDHVGMQAIIDDAYSKLAHASAGGLRDKAGRCGGGGQNPVPSHSSTTGSGGETPAGGGCILSDGVSESLRTLAREADNVREIARACQADRAKLTSKP